MYKFTLLACLPILAGCWIPTGQMTGQTLNGSGTVVTQTFELADFDRLTVGSSFDVNVSQGNEHSVVVEADDNLMEHLDISQADNKLHVGLKSGFHKIRNVTLKAQVVLPRLAALDASGASRVVVESMAADDLAIHASGASRVSGDVACSGRLKTTCGGASHVTLTGAGGSLTADVSGASSLSLTELQVGDANVTASGASRIEVTATGTLTAGASGASRIRYGGEPVSVKKNSSGASSVKQR